MPFRMTVRPTAMLMRIGRPSATLGQNLAVANVPLGNSSFTLSVWVRMDKALPTYYYSLFGVYNQTANGWLHVGPHGVGIRFVDGGFPSVIGGNIPYIPGTDMHVAASWDNGSGNVTVYVNGAVLYTGTSMPSQTPNITQIILGSGWGSTALYPNTLLWEFHAWSRVLSSSEVQQDYILNPPRQGMVGWWPCDDGSGTTLRDISGNGNKMTITTTGYAWYSYGASRTPLAGKRPTPLPPKRVLVPAR